MTNKAENVKEAPRRGYRSARNNIDAVAPIVQRVMNDTRTREALRDLLAAGRDVRDQVRHGGGKAAIQDHRRRSGLTSDIETSAKALRAAAGRMEKARQRQRRRRGTRIIAGVALIAGIVMTVRNKLTAQPDHETHAGSNGAAQWSGVPQGSRNPAGTDHPAGVPHA